MSIKTSVSIPVAEPALWLVRAQIPIVTQILRRNGKIEAQIPIDISKALFLQWWKRSQRCAMGIFPPIQFHFAQNHRLMGKSPVAAAMQEDTTCI